MRVERDVDFMPHGRGSGQRVDGQLRYVSRVIIVSFSVFLDSCMMSEMIVIISVLLRLCSL